MGYLLEAFSTPKMLGETKESEEWNTRENTHLGQYSTGEKPELFLLKIPPEKI